VPFPSQHTLKGSIKHLPRSAHHWVTTGAPHLPYPLNLRCPACRQVQRTIPFCYVKQEHVSRFLTPNSDFLAGPHFYCLLIFLISEVVLAHTQRISAASARIRPFGLKRRSLLRSGERRLGTAQVMSICSSFRRGGRKSRENK